MFEEITVQTKSLLLTGNEMTNHQFINTVILITEKNKNSVKGIILNHHSNDFLTDVINIDLLKTRLFNGGPMDDGSLYFLYNLANNSSINKNSKEHLHIIHFNNSPNEIDNIKKIIKENKLTSKDFKFIKGHIYWTANELENEINQKHWSVHNSYGTNLIFLNNQEKLWKSVLIEIGIKYT